MLDQELVFNIKRDIEAEISIKELASRHGALISKITSKYATSLLNVGSSVYDIENEKLFLVYRAALSYNEEKKTKFSTYLASFVRWYCLNKINKSDNLNYLDEAHIKELPSESSSNDTLEYVTHLINSLDDPRMKDVIKLRYFSDAKLMSWNDIGTKLGYSGQACNNWFKKGLKVLNARVEGG